MRYSVADHAGDSSLSNSLLTCGWFVRAAQWCDLFDYESGEAWEVGEEYRRSTWTVYVAPRVGAILFLSATDAHMLLPIELCKARHLITTVRIAKAVRTVLL